MSILKTNKDGTLIVLSGPSGVGKGTIVKEILKTNKDIWVSISATTRKPRGKEQNGVEYFFLSKEEFESGIKDNKFLEYAIVHNNDYYGTPKEKIDEKLSQGIDVILEIDIQGALKINDLVKDALFIFIMPPTMDILINRLIERNTENKEKIIKRFKAAYKEINEVKKYNYVVINDELYLAVKKVESILLSEKCRVDRIEEVTLDNTEEFIHEKLVDMQ
ncbi:MAG: guanylate kinase [Mycoplasmatota bacterium]